MKTLFAYLALSVGAILVAGNAAADVGSPSIVAAPIESTPHHQFLLGLRMFQSVTGEYGQLHLGYVWGINPRLAWKTELMLVPAQTVLESGLAYRMTSDSAPVDVAFRAGPTIISSTLTPQASVALGGQAGVYISRRFGHGSYSPALTLGGRYEMYVSSWPLFPTRVEQGRFLLAWEMAATKWLGLVAEVSIYLPRDTNGYYWARPTIALGFVF